MKDHDNSRTDSIEDLARLIRSLYQQAWHLIADWEAPAPGSPDDPAAFETALEGLLQRLRRHVDALFEHLLEQSRSFYIPHETLMAATAQFAALQEIAHQSLGQLESSWMGATLRLYQPRLGLFQHRQERLQAVSENLTEMRSAQAAYLDIARASLSEAIDGFDRLIQTQAGPLTLRELHDLWVSAGERAHEQMIESEAYSLALARLANASAALTASTQESLDDLLAYFNLPTRREVTSTQQRLHDLRRRQRAAERAVPAELDALRREMAQLRDEVAQLQRSRRQAPPRGTGKKPRRAG